MLSVIRIALKWLIGLLCGYVITTTGVRQAYHIRHQSEGCIMIYRLFLVKVLHSHNDNNKWDFFFLVLYPPGWFVQIHVSKVLPQLIFQLCILQEHRNHFNICTILSGCSVKIPVGSPLFKLWREKLVW